MWSHVKYYAAVKVRALFQHATTCVNPVPRDYALRDSLYS